MRWRPGATATRACWPGPRPTDVCIGIPMRVVTVDGVRARCEGRGETLDLDCMLVERLAPGAWVLAFRGAAVRVLSADEAAATNDALDALAAVLAGDATGFADLTDREPVLPAHLRGDPA